MLAFFAVPTVTAVGMVGSPGAATAGTSSTFVTGIDRPGVQEPLFIATDPNLGLVWVTSKEATRALYELSATTANVLASVDPATQTVWAARWVTSGASQVAEIVEARRPTNKLKPSLQSPINEKYVTLSEGGSYGLPARTVTFQARDRDSVPAIVDWDQEAGSYAAKAPAFAHLSWIVER